MTTAAPPARPVQIARLARVSLLVRGLLYLLLSFGLGFGLYLGVRKTLFESDYVEGRAILALLLGPFLVWWALAWGLLRLRVALLGGPFIHANVTGVHYRGIPDRSLTLGFGPAIEGTVGWDQFRHCSSHTVRYVGIPVTRKLYLIHLDKKFTEIDLYPFKESIDEIIAAINRARPG